LDTNDLLHRWSTLSLAEIEDEIVRGDDEESVARLIGPETVAEIRGISFSPPAAGPREDVVLLPGIMGSMLSSIRGVTTLLWINPLLFVQGKGRYLRMGPDGESDESPDVEIVPIGLEKMTYLKISLLLNRQTNLHEFPYDWRRPIEYNADILHTCIERWSEGDPNRKFSLVAHSMGGLVSRTYMARHPDSAEKHIRRVIMHGTPNYGATNAIDNLINGNWMMATADRLNQQNDMRDLVYCLPSVYQLLPAPRECLPAGSSYPANFEIYDAAAWGLPKIQQKYLDSGRRLHESLAASDPQIPQAVIAGCHVETLVSVELVPDGAGLRLQQTQVGEGENSGDGTVPLWSARLQHADVYYIQEGHRNLPGNGKIIQATLNLILNGSCDLPQSIPARRGLSFGVEAPLAFDLQAEDLRAKIESGTAGEKDLEKLYFAY